jgi:hypothetical protein
MEIKVNQFVKIADKSKLKQVYSIDDKFVEVWSGGNLVKYKKEYIEYSVDVDTSHLSVLDRLFFEYYERSLSELEEEAGE